MRIITNLKQLKRRIRKPAVAIGIFDGVHLGHKIILREAVKEARRTGGTSVVVTFDPHPQKILDMIGAPPLIVSLRHRLRLMEEEGVAAAVVLNFNKAFASRNAEQFTQDVLIKKIGAHSVVVGEDFRFGRNLKGDCNFLRLFRDSFSVKVVPLLKIGGLPVSSTRIRKLITCGKLAEASRLLGRPVSVLGTVVRGSGRGRILGFPTANIDPHHEAIPPAGVYAVYAIIGKCRYKGVLNIGVRPTFTKGKVEPTIETHISGFKGNLYGKYIEVIFIKRLREEKRFPSKEKLAEQIRIDERNAVMVL